MWWWAGLEAGQNLDTPLEPWNHDLGPLTSHLTRLFNPSAGFQEASVSHRQHSHKNAKQTPAGQQHRHNTPELF